MIINTVISWKSFEQLVIRHTKAGLLATHFAYCLDHSTEDAISSIIHFSLSHVEKK